MGPIFPQFLSRTISYEKVLKVLLFFGLPENASGTVLEHCEISADKYSDLRGKWLVGHVPKTRHC
jgi:hypothetical protein